LLCPLSYGRVGSPGDRHRGVPGSLSRPRVTPATSTLRQTFPMAIPIGDLNPTRRRSYVTLLLIAINVGVFVFLQPWSGGYCEQNAFYLEWGAIPNEIVEGEPLTQEEINATVDPRCG